MLTNSLKTYAPYFPNVSHTFSSSCSGSESNLRSTFQIVFVGPESREDKGFSHSYDVLVDSYQSEEDLSDMSYYKMAGRVGIFPSALAQQLTMIKL